MFFELRNYHICLKILIVILTTIFGIQSLLPIEVEAGSVRVRGYFRSDGTYVSPHYRTSPDGNPYNNYSFPGNFNPNTGRITPGDTKKYLDRYYNSTKSNSSSADIDKLLKSIETQLQSSNPVKVNSYFRQDGTYVSPHKRTAPDVNPYNNYSFPGNFNPNTGRITPGDAKKYLDRYYNSTKSNSSSADIDKLLKSIETQLQSSNPVKVNSYFRQDGTYVSPHKRTVPHGNFNNDYSFPDNSNSNTGRNTSRNRTEYLHGISTRNQSLTTKKDINNGYFTVGSKMSEVVAVQGTPNSFSETKFDYGYSTVYFRNGRVTSWYNSKLNPLNAKLAAIPTSQNYFTVGSTKGEVVAVQGTPNTFTETRFDYGLSSVYFNNDRVTRWTNSNYNPLKVRLRATPSGKNYFTVGSTKGEVVAVQGTPNTFTERRFDYGLSSVYFNNDRVTRWTNSNYNPLKARLRATPSGKNYFTVGSTKGEVVAVQGTPNAFTETRFDYGLSSIYFNNDRVTHWRNSNYNPLKARLRATPSGKNYFTVGSTKGEVVAVQGTPNTFTETRFDYGLSSVYFNNDRVTRWTNSNYNPLKARLRATPSGKNYFTVGSTKGEVVAVQGTPNAFTERRFDYGLSSVYFNNDRVTRWTNSNYNPLKARLRATPSGKNYFAVGSTKGEVVAVQGTPNAFTETRFDYGLSSIYFNNDRVTHWRNSNYNPLRVR